MLSEAEKEGCVQLLDKLQNDEILSLKNTITNRLIAVENRAEAVMAIIEYSQSAVELLRRRKIRRDLLFQYLAECSVVVPINSEKQDLIRRVLELWGSSVPSNCDLTETESTTAVAEPVSSPEQQPKPSLQQPKPSLQQPKPSLQQPKPSLQQSKSSLQQPKPSLQQSKPSLQQSKPSLQQSNPPLQQSNSSLQQPNPPLQQRLGETFVRWFYQLLNSENPSYDAAVEDRFGPHHFWDDCILKLVSRTPDMTEEAFEGNVLTAQRLQALTREECLLLNPNVGADGVRVQSNPHGLLIIMACGTIHQHNRCLGIFEQVFGLIRNPYNEVNWKVKVTELHMHSSQVSALPKLSDSSAKELLSIAGSMSVALRD